VFFCRDTIKNNPHDTWFFNCDNHRWTKHSTAAQSDFGSAFYNTVLDGNKLLVFGETLDVLDTGKDSLFKGINAGKWANYKISDSDQGWSKAAHVRKYGQSIISLSN